MGLGTRARTALAVFVLGTSLGTARSARAETREAREQEAKRACLASRPDEGIEILAGLYAETNEPTYLYNQARCFEQNGRAQDAVHRFREYLRKSPSIAAEERAQVQAHIAELEQQLRQDGAAAAAPAARAPVTAPSVVAVGAPDREGDEVRSHRLRVAGIVTASVGAAALVGGLFMGWRAQALSDEVTKDANNHVYSRSKDDDGHRAETLQWIGYGVGGAALVGGGLLYYVGTARRGDDASPATALLPVLAPGTAGACLRMRF